MTCPICKGPTVADFRPFCSRRCADLDLGRWLSGGYVIAGAEDESAELTEGENSAQTPLDTPARHD